MKRGLVISGVLFLLMVSMVLAVETTITVKTEMDRDVAISVLNDNDNVVSEFKNKSDENGEYTVDLSTTESFVDVVVAVRKNGKFEYGGPQRYDNQKTSLPIVINLKEVVEEEIEVVLENETEVVVVTEPVVEPALEVLEETEIIEEEKSKSITGMIVGGGKSIITSKKTYYAIGGIVGVFVLLFIVIFGRKKMDIKGKDIKIRKLDDGSYDAKLEDAERKLEEAKQELDDIKNRKRKLTEAKEKLKRDQEELRKIEGDD